MNGHQDDNPAGGLATAAEPERKVGRSRWKRWVVYAAAAFVLMPLAGAVVVSVLHMLVTDSAEVLRLHEFATRLHAAGLAAQSLAVALVLGRWKALVAWASAKGIVQPFEIERALAFRGKAAVFLLLYLLLIPIGPARIWSLIAGVAG